MPYPSDGDDRSRPQPDPAARVTVAGRLVARPGATEAVLALFSELIAHVQAHEPGTEINALLTEIHLARTRTLAGS